MKKPFPAKIVGNRANLGITFQGVMIYDVLAKVMLSCGDWPVAEDMENLDLARGPERVASWRFEARIPRIPHEGADSKEESSLRKLVAQPPMPGPEGFLTRIHIAGPRVQTRVCPRDSHEVMEVALSSM